MTIISVITVSIFTTLATLAVLLFAAKHRCRRRGRACPAGDHSSGGSRSKHRSPDQSKSMDDTLEYVVKMLNLDSMQLNLWNSLKQELKEAKQNLTAYREVFTDASDIQQRVHRLDDFLNDGLIVLRKLKPKLIEFYHSLNSQQQLTINTMFDGEFLRSYRCH